MYLLLTPAQGLTNLGGLVGIVLAILISGPLTDWGTIWLAKHNKGVYEPEFRIFFISTMLFGVFGYAGWAGECWCTKSAIGTDEDAQVGTTHNMPWIGAVACIAFVQVFLYHRAKSNTANQHGQLQYGGFRSRLRHIFA